MPELSIIVPSFNERENIPILVEALAGILAGVDYEVIVVDDDSDDGTSTRVRQLAQSDRRVRLIHRINRRGLSSACIEGMLASSAPYMAVMDADMQHDEHILPSMLDLIRTGNLDLVIGSRRAEGGSMGEFAPSRIALSEAGRRVATFISEADISDPMSGYFVTTRSYFEQVVHSLSGRGFKILLDLLTSSTRRPRIMEMPYTFRNRAHGDSKLDIVVAMEYLRLILDKTAGRWLPVNYVIYSLVGSIGLALHFLLVLAAVHYGSFRLPVAQTLSGMVVIALNFFLNNELTFRATRLKGSSLLVGLFLFFAACLIGLAGNVEFTGYLSSFGVPWYAASFVGVVIGSVWNYSASSIGIWRKNTRGAKAHLTAPASQITAAQS